MANSYQEVNVLLDGIQAEQPSNGSFAQNVFFRRGTLEVRKGFGQVAQLDTSFGKGFYNDGTKWGYKEHLGSYLFLTDFGNFQVVSVFLAFINSTNDSLNNIVTTTYVVSIYDLDTNTWWEEDLYRKTSENNSERFIMPDWHGPYESTVETDYQDWIAGEDSSFFFEEYRDILFFGSSRAGTFVYYPSLFGKNRIKQIDKTNELDWSTPYGESSIVSKAIPSPGLFTEGIEYFTDSDFPNPETVTYFENRLVYASGRSLFFSDVGQPTNIAVDNFITLTNSQEDITAIVEHYGNIIIFTASETWLYRPSVGALASQGRLDKVSNAIGCIDKNAVTRRNSKIVWLDINGVYEMSNNLIIEKLSDKIDTFFKDFISNPLTSYFTSQGFSGLDGAQPKTTLSFFPGKIKLQYVEDLELLLICLPGQNHALCQSKGGQWSLWSFDSIASVKESFSGLTVDSTLVTADNTLITADNSTVSLGFSPVVGIQENIQNPWILSNRNKFVLVGSIDDQDLSDNSLKGGGPRVDEDTLASSYYILEYGRGGALDRNIDEEDNRTVAGKYEYSPPVFVGDGGIYWEKLEKVPEGFTFPGGLTIATGGKSFLVPIEVVPREGTTVFGIDRYTIIFKFDNTHWRPVFFSGTEIDFILPPERLAGKAGFSQGAPIPGLAEVQCYNSGGVPDITGNEIRIHWDGATAPNTWRFYPHMNIGLNQKNTLIYIPMLPAGISTEAVSGMGIEPLTHFLEDNTNSLGADLVPTVWSEWFLPFGVQRRRDNVAQSVDWLYKSDNVGLNDAGRIKARGILIRALSHSKGTDQQVVEWPLGILNTIIGADRKEYMSQFLDYNGDDIKKLFPGVILDDEGLIDIKSRFKNFNTQLLTKKLFNNADIEWGSKSDSAVGNFLIDDEDVSEYMTSDILKGKSFTYMIFGFMRNRGNRLVFEKFTTMFRVTTDSRRRRQEVVVL